MIDTTLRTTETTHPVMIDATLRAIETMHQAMIDNAPGYD